MPTLSKYRFLNWAPGPLDTTMFHYIKGLIKIQSWILIFDTLGKMIETDTNAEMWKTMKPLKPKFSAEQLFELLKRNQEEWIKVKGLEKTKLHYLKNVFFDHLKVYEWIPFGHIWCMVTCRLMYHDVHSSYKKFLLLYL